MAAGDEGKTISEVADRLCAEFGDPIGDLPHDVVASRYERCGPFSTLSLEDERLIAAAREGLVRLSLALRPRQPHHLSEMTVGALLNGAEMVMRDELAKGNRLSAVMPSIVYLVAVPAVDQDEAFEISERAASLLEGSTD